MTRLRFDPAFEELSFRKLQDYLSGLWNELNEVPADRQEVLCDIARFVAAELKEKDNAKLVFICTHNSRRSHFGQIWAGITARALGVEGVETYSGGTAVTAFNHRAADALERAGFRIHRPEGRNPAYEVAWSGRSSAMICFSKIYDDERNPRSGFGAVMTCSQADQSCPIVPGAVERFGLAYNDPKTADGTAKEAARYDERCRQVAREMLFLFSRVQEIL